ncbi:hypothetical protein, partial [Xenorhabdus bovienii]|uniref:hypothetical protein n=1 Tax=Xenorhabdus bovienii TaxID=40576 RepID=UPI0023B2489C
RLAAGVADSRRVYRAAVAGAGKGPWKAVDQDGPAGSIERCPQGGPKSRGCRVGKNAEMRQECL